MIFEELDGAGVARVLLLSDPPSGLRAILVIDSLRLGPAAGGIRTRTYLSFRHALADARRLASAMTLKCAIAGLDAGGAKTVVIAGPGMNRPAAFRKLGQFIGELRGLYWAAGDLGTTEADLKAAAEATPYVNTGGPGLAAATGRTVLNGIRACAAVKGLKDLSGLRVAIQGCGLIGSGVADALVAEGASLIISDTELSRAEALAARTGALVVPPDRILEARADILSPCADGGMITRDLVRRIRAWGICGGANNQLVDADETSKALLDADILYVPDFLASAGAVIMGIAGPVMNVDPEPLLDATLHSAVDVLDRSRQSGVPSSIVAERLAKDRIDKAPAPGLQSVAV